MITLSLAFAALCAPPCAFALDTGDIVITSLKGEVHVTMSGAERAVRAGGVLELPATVQTGADGAIELRQGATTVAVGPDTLLEFPALEKPGGPIDRIVQPRGNAFYNIGKRQGRKLRIETPYLVGVVKGTQFNVVAQQASTTISLFEGLLEIRSADDSDVIDLHAGEIAARSRADTDINVLKMNGDRPPAAPPAPRAPAAPQAPQSPSGAEGKDKPAPAPGPTRSAPARDDGDSRVADREGANSRPVVATPASPASDLPVELPERGSVSVDIPVSTVANEIPAFVDPAPLGPPEITAPVDSGSPVVETVTETVASAAPPAVEIGGGAAQVDLEVPGNAAPVDLGASPGGNAGGVADVQIDVTPSPGAGVPADVGVAVAVDPPAPNVDLGLGVAAGNVDLGVSVGGADVLDVSLGGGDNSGPGSVNQGPGNNGNGQGNDGIGPGNNGQGNNDKASVVDDVANLLDGIRGKSGKKK